MNIRNATRQKRHIANFRQPLSIALLVSPFVLPMPASANKPANITAAEMALLPKYCPDTMGFNYGDAFYNTSPRAPYWVARMGKGFWAVHHYCWALINLSRATRPGVPREFKIGTLENVRGDHLYVIEHAPADFVLLPEIFSRLGEVELLLKQPRRAEEAFAKARQLKPDYWPAYSHWVEYLIREDKRQDAKSLVQQGLEHSPNAKVLLEQYRLLGGRPEDLMKDSARKDTPAPSPTPPSTVASPIPPTR